MSSLLTSKSYGSDFIEHSYRYHFTRIDHRHNFSVYNTVLHLNSAGRQDSSFRVESLAFVPQLFLSVGIIPFLLAKKDLASTMLAQTFAFVTFNKVCTSQVCRARFPVLANELIFDSTSFGTWSFCPSICHLHHSCPGFGWV